MVYQEQSLNYKPGDKDIRFDFETIKDTKLLYIATKGGSGDVSIILKRTDKQGVQTGIQHFVETAGNNEQAFTEETWSWHLVCDSNHDSSSLR